MLSGQLNCAADDMIPSDIWIHHNEITKPTEHNPLHPDYDGQQYSGCKNIFESKGSVRVLMEFNRLSHSWISGQSGQGIMTYCVNQNNVSPWMLNEDWVIHYNEWDDINTFFHTMTRGAWDVAESTRRFHVANNVVKNLNSPYTGSGTTRVMIFIRDTQTGLLPGFSQMVFLNNTLLVKDGNRTGLTLLEFTGPNIAEGGAPHSGLVFRDNIFGNSDYLIFGGPQGQAALDAHAPDTIFENNIVVRCVERCCGSPH